MSGWTSGLTIINDLSLAQGRIVTSSIEVTSGDRPPALVCTEETEEEYYKDHIIDDVDFRSGPDIRLIQEMLSLVESEESNHQIAETENAPQYVVVSKLNPATPDFVPTAKLQRIPQQAKTYKPVLKQTKHKQHAWERNVAMRSILENKARKSEISDVDAPRVPVSSEMGPPVTVKKPLGNSIALPIMFQRKTMEKPEKDADRKAIMSPSKNDYVSTYKPSTLAEDYYNQFVQRNKIKQIQEDIWTRVEKEMKVLDEKRKMEAAASSSSSSVTFDDVVTSSPIELCSGIEYVTLQQHRHLLTDASCIVCEIAQKHGYDFKEELHEE